MCFNLASAEDARKEMWKDEKRGRARPVSEWEGSEDDLKKARNNDRTWYRFTYEVVIEIMGTELNFDVVAPPGPEGKSYGSRKLSIGSDL